MANELQHVINEMQQEEKYDLATVAQCKAFKMLLTRAGAIFDKQLSSLEYAGDDKQFAFDYMKIKQRKEFAQEFLESLFKLHNDIQREIHNDQTM